MNLMPPQTRRAAGVARLFRMDRKSVIVLVVCFILLIMWYPLVNRWYGLPPAAQGTNVVAGPTNAVASGTNSSTSAPGASTSSVPGGMLVKSDAPEELVVVENDDVRYTFTSHGGG